MADEKVEENMVPYSSKADTLEHIRLVNTFLIEFATEILRRAKTHDQSKLEEPELGAFDRETPKLKGLAYGSQEYKNSLARLGPALRHHYESNRHHPEFWPLGVNDMNLEDLVEMFCDWKAATQRAKDGNIHKSIEINQKRFGLSNQLTQILRNSI